MINSFSVLFKEVSLVTTSAKAAHQQEIDWQRVADSGVQFAILRVGYRGYTEGAIQEDAYFTQNLEGAIDAGLDVGVYFFSQAIDEQEAREEARFVLDKISGYLLAFPVFFDWEKIGSEARSDTMDLASLTIVTDTFCTEIRNAGYQAGLYFNQQLGYEELHLPSLQTYTFWLAEYNDTPSFAYHFEALTKIAGGVTFVNSVASTVCVVVLYLALRPALERAGLLPKGETN